MSLRTIQREYFVHTVTALLHAYVQYMAHLVYRGFHQAYGLAIRIQSVQATNNVPF
jgi:hypothetical protein